MRNFNAHHLKYRRGDAAGGGAVDDWPAQEIEQTKRRVMGCGHRSTEQKRVCGAISGRKLDESVADQVTLLSSGAHTGC